MNNLLKYKIIFPELPAIEGETDKLVLNSKCNPLTILVNHAPMIGVIEKGVLKINNDNGESKEYNYYDGYFSVKDGNVIVNILRH